MDRNSNIRILENVLINNAPVKDQGSQESSRAAAADLTHADIIKNATLVDEGIQEPAQYADVPLTQAELIRNATIIDKGIKLCPLCHNEVRLFFINFNEKVLMCENPECDFPFGHEELTFVKENSYKDSNEEVDSLADLQSRPASLSYRSPPSSATCSIISNSDWSDIDKINKIIELEHASLKEREYYNHKRLSKKEKVKNNVKRPEIFNNVEALKRIGVELNKADESCIRNKKWLENLMDMQQSSSRPLLKPQEINLCKQKKPELGLGELKIDINPGSTEHMSLIKIEIGHTDAIKKQEK